MDCLVTELVAILQNGKMSNKPTIGLRKRFYLYHRDIHVYVYSVSCFFDDMYSRPLYIQYFIQVGETAQNYQDLNIDLHAGQIG